MTPPKLAGTAATLALAASLTFTAGASAARAGQSSFAQIYPRASVLCAHVTAGRGPQRLRRSAATVVADCTTLQNGFNLARTTVLAGVAQVAAAQAAARAVTRTACAGPAANSTACLHSRHKRDHTLDLLARQRARFARAFFRTVEANRLLFWGEIRALPGGRDVREDAPIPLQST